MNIIGIFVAAATIGITGLVIGIVLGLAEKKFHVDVNELEIQIRECLPGNNCGGCGFAGCDAMAKAMAENTAAANACPVASEAQAGQIAAILGVSVENMERQAAYVKCSGTCDRTKRKYEYYGIQDCRKLALIPGRGTKVCADGCMGLGSCASECPFDAISIVNGVAVVNREQCKACGICVAVCPNHLIELTPYSAKYHVTCFSKNKGKAVKDACMTGCIGCGICVKQCEYDAIKVENNLAAIDQSKCTGCGKCAEKCPVKVIQLNGLS